MIYTAFCQQTNGRGTIWISTVEASSLEEAIETAREECAADWEYETGHVHVLGIAEGNVNLAYWQDIDA